MDTAAIFPVLTLIVGGACILLLVSTKTLRDSRDDQEKRIKQLEEERTRDKDLIAGQAGQIDALGKVVTGEVHLVAISDLLTQHHNESVQNWGTASATLAHIDETLATLGTALKGMK